MCTLGYFLLKLIEEIERVAEVAAISVVFDEWGNDFVPFSVVMVGGERPHY